MRFVIALLLAAATQAAEPPNDSAAYVRQHVARLNGAVHVLQVSHITFTNNGAILAYTASGDKNTGTIFCIVAESVRDRFLDRYPRTEVRQGKRIATKPLQVIVRKVESGAIVEVDPRYFGK